MGEQVFATKWDLLFASVLIGVDRSTGVFSGSEPAPGQQMVAVWTDESFATEALHVESWELRTIRVRDLLALLPSGIGIVVDPERSSGMTASASYVANLRPYVEAFPAGSAVRLGPWELPDGVRAAVAQAADPATVGEVHAFSYTVDDSPTIGCLAHVPGATGDASAVSAALEAALTASADITALGLATVNVMPLASVPEEVRGALGGDHVVHRPQRSRFWRR